MFKAIWLDQADGKTRASVRQLSEADLPAGDTTVRIEYSTLNYKDALAITGRSPVVRKFPMVPGIDCAGTVEATSFPGLQVGDKVVLTGWGHGELHWGGLAEKARVSGERLLKLPAGMSARQAMAVGTAGLTAMLAVLAIERHGSRPENGDVLVTGAGGGVGGFAVAFMSRSGWRVQASSGRPMETERIKRLGASEVLPRSELGSQGKSLQKERWAAVVDSLGSHTLANACAGTRYGGIVAACGLAQGMDFPSSVAPFILRGVHLAGIDSVYASNELRAAAWARIAAQLGGPMLDDLVQEISLEGAVPSSAELIGGGIKGRLVVAMAGSETQARDN